MPDMRAPQKTKQGYMMFYVLDLPQQFWKIKKAYLETYKDHPEMLKDMQVVIVRR